MGICKKCGATGKIHVHHIDSNHDNNEPTNLAELCPRCHIREHVPQRLARNKAKRESSPYYRIDQSKPGWSKGMSWDELLSARDYPSINTSNL